MGAVIGACFIEDSDEGRTALWYAACAANRRVVAVLPIWLVRVSVAEMETRRPGSVVETARRTMAFSRLPMVAVAPIARPTVRMTTIVNPGDRRSARNE